MQRAENFMVADIKCSREWRTLSNYIWWISFWGTPEQLHTIISRCWARREIFALIHHTFARQSITWIFYMRIFEPPALGHPSRTCVICSESWTTPGNRSLFLKQNHQIKKRFHANKLPARVKKIHLWNLAIRQGPTAVKLDWNVMGESIADRCYDLIDSKPWFQAKRFICQLITHRIPNIIPRFLWYSVMTTNTLPPFLHTGSVILSSRYFGVTRETLLPF